MGVVSIQNSQNPRKTAAITLGTLFLGYCGYYLCRSCLPVCSTSLIADNKAAGFDKLAYGSMVSWGIAVYSLGKLLNGRVVDRFGGKVTFVIGLLLSAGLTAVFGLGAPSIFVVAWCVNRYVQSIGWPGMMSLASRWFPFEQRALVAGFLSMSFSIGDAGVRFGLGMLLEHHWGWRSIFLFSSCAAACIAVIGIFLIRRPEDMEIPAAPTAIAEEPESTSRLVALALLKRVDFWIVCWLSCGLTLIRETFNNWSVLFLKEVVGMSESAAAKGSSVFPFAGAFAVIAAGWMTRRIGNRHGIVTAASLAGLVVALLVMGRVSLKGEPALAIGMLAAASMMLLGPYSYCAGVMAMELGGKKGTATAAGWIDAAGYVGSIAAGKGVAEISVRYGWQMAFDILAGVSVLMIATAIAYSFFKHGDDDSKITTALEKG